MWHTVTTFAGQLGHYVQRMILEAGNKGHPLWQRGFLGMFGQLSNRFPALLDSVCQREAPTEVLTLLFSRALGQIRGLLGC